MKKLITTLLAFLLSFGMYTSANASFVNNNVTGGHLSSTVSPKSGWTVYALSKAVFLSIQEQVAPRGVRVLSVRLAYRGGNVYTGYVELYDGHYTKAFPLQVTTYGRNFYWKFTQ